jgi:hypothetical protein
LTAPYLQTEKLSQAMLKSTWKLALCLLLVGLALSGCQAPKPARFAIYLVASDLTAIQALKVGLFQLPLQSQPVLSSEDILSYTQDTHQIELTEAGYRRIQALFPTPVRVSGIPFVACVGDERIYLGAFWTPLSSLSFGGVTIMQPMDPNSRSIQIQLGYPGPDFAGQADPRSDPRILESLRAAGKLR